MAKYVFVTGGVTSSLGKGIIAASLAKILQSRGFSVTIQKFDPYINVDPGTLNPYEHGECFVTDDGAETDLDLGHYERYLGVPTSLANNVTTGKVYQTVIEKERRGEFLGKTVQVIPHITNEIKRRFQLLEQSGDYDIIITEIGGTIGDIESLPYMEAIRQFKWDIGAGNFLLVHLTLVPYLASAKELKTKPTQHSVKNLLSLGVQPDILVCRTEHPLPNYARKKIASFCNVEVSSVIEARDAETIYDVPLLMLEEHLDTVTLKKLDLPIKSNPNLIVWSEFLRKLKNPKREITVALVGKYNELQDAYKSIYEAFVHAGAANECKVNIKPIHSEKLEAETDFKEVLAGVDGVLVAPGFGDRGLVGKIKAIKYVREQKIPFFGICLGMQMAAVEFAQNVLGLEDAYSTEMKPNCAHPVIDLMESQKTISDKGGTMRLGAYSCELDESSKVFQAYGKKTIEERHRHRWEFNNKYLKAFAQAGMKPVGMNKESNLVEIIELEDHPWFVGVQFHPEYKSRVEAPHPLFMAFVEACMSQK
ncbi:MAG TPA: CTP synthase [Saprospiraceae bacterium]|nr:CTP synthase [Saprospiraceae bacterium]